jgi:hypothetical protein
MAYSEATKSLHRFKLACLEETKSLHLLKMAYLEATKSLHRFKLASTRSETSKPRTVLFLPQKKLDPSWLLPRGLPEGD